MTTATAWPFPTSSEIAEQKKPDQVRVIRHLRANQRTFNARTGLFELTDAIEPKGGLTFQFEIDYTSLTLSFAVAACHPEENFNTVKANDKVAKMFENGCTFEGTYNPELSLIDNAYNIFVDVYNDGLDVRGYDNFTLRAIGGQMDYALQRGLHDPNFVNLTFEVRIPTHKREDFDLRVQDIIEWYIEEANAQRAAQA